MDYRPRASGTSCATCGREQEPGARFCPSCGASAPGGGPGYVPGLPYLADGEYMGFWIRVVANLIDGILIGVAFLVLLSLGFVLLFGDFLGPVGVGLGVAFWVISIVSPWIYHVAFITAKGQTIGKMIVGVQVVNREGNIPGFGSVLLRETVGKLLSNLAFSLGYLWVAWDPEKRGWHDHIGGTYVVRKGRG